jgi:hypothetical protein
LGPNHARYAASHGRFALRLPARCDGLQIILARGIEGRIREHLFLLLTQTHKRNNFELPSLYRIHISTVSILTIHSGDNV